MRAVETWFEESEQCSERAASTRWEFLGRDGRDGFMWFSNWFSGDPGGDGDKILLT